jgi:uncharacterized protein with GYD domain
VPTYIMLMKWTDQGIKNIKNVTQRVQGNIKAFEALGGKVIGTYIVMGEYDLIAIGEAPSDEVATAFVLGMAAQGYVRTTTLKAFSAGQFADIVKKLP